MPANKASSAGKGMSTSWIRQPALHFVVLGGLIFGLHAVVAEPGPNPDVIDVSVVRLRALQGELTRQLGRAPTPDELDTRIEQYIGFEILFREAVALELDQGDMVVRRRLIQKMEFLIQDLAVVSEPPDDVLESFLEEHAERYRRPGTATFEHLFFNHGAERAEVEIEAQAALEAARRGDSIEGVGDPFPLGRRFVGRTRPQVASVLGEGLAEAVFAAEEGVWVGPVSSRYGLHVVRVAEQRLPRNPPLEEVRARVRGEWLEERREEANRVAQRRLRRRYDIRVATIDRVENEADGSEAVR